MNERSAHNGHSYPRAVNARALSPLCCIARPLNVAVAERRKPTVTYVLVLPMRSVFIIELANFDTRPKPNGVKAQESEYIFGAVAEFFRIDRPARR